MVVSKLYIVVSTTQLGAIYEAVASVPNGGTLDFQAFHTYFAVFAVVALPIFGVGFVHYMVLVRFSLLHGLQPLSPTARVQHSASILWLLEIGSLARYAAEVTR